jgi:arylformamidase
VLYREFETQAALDAQYNVSENVEDATEYAEFYTEKSRAVRADLDCHLDVSFGPTVAERLDVFPADRPNAPILLFIHGGYWHSRTAEEFDFVARGPVSAGVTTVVMNYALCPTVSIDELVRQTRAAVVWLADHAAEFGADGDRIHVAGHSAGGHLTGMLLTTDWEEKYGQSTDIIEGACTISGLFDLEPFPYTWLQPKLQLTWDEVRRNSPIRHLPAEAPPLLVSYGAEEPAELRRQSADFLTTWQQAGLDGSRLPQPGANHYTAIEGFLDADSRLCSAILDQIED